MTGALSPTDLARVRRDLAAFTAALDPVRP
jgi:hypothetical protein